jgi:hypothetical protein
MLPLERRFYHNGKAMNLLRYSAVAALLVFMIAGCDSNALVDDAESPTTVSESDQASLGKREKPDNGGGGGGGDKGKVEDPPMYAVLVPSGDTPKANELTDPDGEGGRLGGGWAAGLGVIWDDQAQEWVWSDDGRATSDACDGSFGLLEANMKAGKVTTIWLRGGDSKGTDWSSDKIAVTAQDPDAVNGWTLEIRTDIVINEGKGGQSKPVCTVYVHDVVYCPVSDGLQNCPPPSP